MSSGTLSSSFLSLALLVGVSGTALASPVSRSSISDDLIQTTLPDGGTFGTVSGDVTVQSSTGSLSASSVSGDIEIGSAQGDLKLRSVSGTLKIGSATGNVSLANVSGDITVGPVRGDLRLHTTSGDVTLGNVTGLVDVVTVSGDVQATLTGKGGLSPNITITTVSGTVVLHVPHDFGGTVDLEIKEARSEIGKHHITQNFGLPVEVGAWDSRMLGTDTRTLSVKGHVGTGSATLTVHGTRTDITVLRD